MFLALIYVEAYSLRFELLGLIALILSYFSMGLVYTMTQKGREEKEKVFYQALVQFLEATEKFSIKEGNQIQYINIPSE